MQICENIKRERLSAGKTQQEMADALGVKRTTYANWEQKTEPNLTTIKSIAAVLGIDFSVLLGTTNAVVDQTNDALVAALHAVLIEVYAQAFGVDHSEAMLHVRNKILQATRQRGDY